MTIIELVRKVLTEFPRIQELTDYVHVDFTKDDSDNYGLSPTGDTLLRKNILGMETRRHNFVLYAVHEAPEDFNRLENSNFLLELNYWLERYKTDEKIEFEIGNNQFEGELISLSSANGMLYGLQNGDINSPVMYQLQIYATYTLAEV